MCSACVTECQRSDDPSSLPSTMVSWPDETPKHEYTAKRCAPSLRDNLHWVFFFGSLRRGFANHAILQDATYIGEFRSQEAYPLVVAGCYFAPCLVDAAGRGGRVPGEVYAVSSDTLARLDALQNVGPRFTRRPIRVSAVDDPSFCASAHVYLRRADDTAPLLKSPVPALSRTTSPSGSSEALRGGDDEKQRSSSADGVTSILDMMPPKPVRSEPRLAPALAEVVGAPVYAGCLKKPGVCPNPSLRMYYEPRTRASPYI